MKRSFWTALLRQQAQPVSFRPQLEGLEELILPSSNNIVPTYVLSQPITPTASSGTVSGLTPAQVNRPMASIRSRFKMGPWSATVQVRRLAVDAYDDPSIASDLAVFDQQFGLQAPPSFTKVGINSADQASTTKFPVANSGWDGEIELDVEWAHAIAPGANILLVEANSASNTDLLNAVNYARSQPGVVAVSMLGESEFSTEANYDSDFTTPAGHGGVSFFGSSGDNGAPAIWPSLSTHVISVGGTTLNVDAQGNYQSESAWSGSGGSLSTVLAQPSYQNGLVIHNGNSVISANGMRRS